MYVFGLTSEQEMIVETVRAFVEAEIYPLEDEVERTGHVSLEMGQEIARKVQDMGFLPQTFLRKLAAGA